MSDGLILLLAGLLVSLSFVSFVHFIVAPLVKFLFYTYEPLMFHYTLKLSLRIKKLKKVWEKFWKSTVKRPYFHLRKDRF